MYLDVKLFQMFIEVTHNNNHMSIQKMPSYFTFLNLISYYQIFGTIGDGL